MKRRIGVLAATTAALTGGLGLVAAPAQAGQPTTSSVCLSGGDFCSSTTTVTTGNGGRVTTFSFTTIDGFTGRSHSISLNGLFLLHSKNNAPDGTQCVINIVVKDGDVKNSTSNC